MSIAVIKMNNLNETVEFDGAPTLSSLLQNSSLRLSLPCGGNHTCGKCKVYANGNISTVSAEEKKLLSRNELASGMRLSCCAIAWGDCELSPVSDSLNTNVLLDGKGNSINAVGYSIAVDIGTTTVAVYLYQNGDLAASLGEHNSQGKFGADVITRIGQGKHNELHECIVNQLDRMVCEVCGGIVEPSEISLLVITGNTTMLHFLMGHDPSSIASYPFTPVSLFGVTANADILFPKLISAKLYIPTCFSSYVGADMLCSILASGMTLSQKGTSLLADIGTNGEMALFHNGKLCACSTAAGPALEGAVIKMGMVAKSGAIDKASLTPDGELKIHTIDNAPAVGICGSGLISAIALLVRIGLIDETGLINEECSEFSHLIISDEDGKAIKLGETSVYITAADIRQFQLAKSAICAGILTMLSKYNITADEVSTFYLCGGFGSYIDPFAAADVGLIPKELSNKVKSLGNAAGIGSAMLFDEAMREKSHEIVELTSIIELSESEYFMEKYIDQMYFKQA